MITLVISVIAASMSSGLMLNVLISGSMNTGDAPTYVTAKAVAM